MLRTNVRAAEAVVGDLWAQVTALHIMEERLLLLMEEHELESIEPLAQEIHGRCERAMREKIAALPDGTWYNELKCDGVGAPVTIKTAVTIDGDTMTIDFTGSSPQLPGAAINVPFPYTYAFTIYAAKCVLSDLPNNEGGFRPIIVKAPEGSIVNSVYPLSGGSRNQVGHYLPASVYLALQEVMPERVIASCGSPLWSMKQSGVSEDGRPYANIFFCNGGMGANAAMDGHSTLSWPSNVSSTPVEMIEHLAPFRVDHKRLYEGSGGAGKHRGGLGQELLYRSLSKRPIDVNFSAERTKFAAEGVVGGEHGTLGAVKINGVLVDNKLNHSLALGDRVEVITPGGGGYGPPAERPAEAIQRDLEEGYSVETTHGS